MSELRKEIKERTFGYIITSLGLVAGLAWNDAIKGFIEYALPLGTGTLFLKFVYAVVVTIIIVFVASNLNRFVSNKE